MHGMITLADTRIQWYPVDMEEKLLHVAVTREGWSNGNGKYIPPVTASAHIPTNDFLIALSIAVHPDGNPGAVQDYRKAEAILSYFPPELRFIVTNLVV